MQLVAKREAQRSDMTQESQGSLYIGWAQTEITPERPVLVRGYSYGRVSEGVLDPLTATVLLLESREENGPATHTVMVSCDIIAISNELRDAIRAKVGERVPELDALHIIVNATHTHNAPEVRCEEDSTTLVGIPLAELGAMEPAEYVDFAAERIAEAVVSAWNTRKPGGISFGLGSVAISHNRISSYFGRANAEPQRGGSGSAFSTGAARQGSGPYSLMYGKTDDPDFSHMEGYVDHSLDLLCTWDDASNLTGVVVNLSCPSQVGGAPHQLTADFWHDTRLELRQRHGDGLYVLPQCSPAGDQNSPHPYRKAAEQRMLEITGRTKRQEIAARIAGAVNELVPWLERCIERSPQHVHQVERVSLSRRLVTTEEMEEAKAELPALQAEFERALQAAQGDNGRPGSSKESGAGAASSHQNEPRWYIHPTRAFWVFRRAQQVIERYEMEASNPKHTIEVHAVRLGEMALATNPFELYLDFGIQIQARSAAVQTFLVQLAGPGTYVPTQRSVEGGAYGAVPASSVVGPEGGRELVNRTVELIQELWNGESKAQSA